MSSSTERHPVTFDCMFAPCPDYFPFLSFCSSHSDQLILYSPRSDTVRTFHASATALTRSLYSCSGFAALSSASLSCVFTVRPNTHSGQLQAPSRSCTATRME